ncbi:MAG: hypothetical protein RJA49_1585 [Actinomycetota bacterium]
MHAADRLVTAVLLGWVYVASGSLTWVGVIALCRLVPALAPTNRVHGVLASSVAFATTAALVGVVATDGPIGVVLALATISAIAGAAARAAASASLIHLGGEAGLATTRASFERGRDLGALIGPAVGALATWALDAAWALGVGTALVVGGGAIARGLAQGAVAPAARARLDHGRPLDQLRSVPFALPLAAIAGTVAATGAAFVVVVAVYAHDRLGLGIEGAALLLSAAALGGVTRRALTTAAGAARQVLTIILGAATVTVGTFLLAAPTRVTLVALVLAAVGGAAVVVGDATVGNTYARLAPPTAARSLQVGVEVASLVGAVAAIVLLVTTTFTTTVLAIGAVAALVVMVSWLRLRGVDAANAAVLDRLESRIAVLERITIIAAAPRPVVERLAAASQWCPLPAGVDVVVQGAPAHAFYAVIDGEVIVHRDGAEIARLGPAQHFGERGLIDQAPRNAGVTTSTRSNLLRIDGPVLLGALSSSPTMLIALDDSNAPS